MMRLWGRRVVLAGIAVFAVAQFIPVTGANPPADPAQAIFANMTVPPDVTGILIRACQDCHSNQTVWPWYSRVAPVSWLVINDVSEGRRELNFSEWGRYNARRQDRKLKEICEQVERGKMPMPIYTLMHPQAKLTASDQKAICEWSAAARMKPAVAATASAR
jgi:Haem-binding domain